ncbi:MAG: DUF1674 domain-containing protein [Rhodospirillales bacterium]|nr:DUF1674 domain-containing protein [Rhodospirillales bacterium]
MPKEIGGPKGPEPTRYGDCEKTADVLIFNIERGIFLVHPINLYADPLRCPRLRC